MMHSRRGHTSSNGRRGASRWTFVVVAVVLAAVFARLGVWQLDRLGERRAANRAVETRMDRPIEELASMLGSAGSAEELAWRRVRVSGTWDAEHEVVIRGRADRGTPGVHVVTPLVYGSDSAVLVLRGWLPAADGLSADLPAAAVPDGGPAEVEGLTLDGEPVSPIPPRRREFEDGERLVLGSLAIEQVEDSLPYQVLPVFLLASRGDEGAGAPRPVAEPSPSDGPHFWYALQWFGFALISVAGALVYLRASRPRAAEGHESLPTEGTVR